MELLISHMVQLLLLGDGGGGGRWQVSALFIV